MFIFDKDNNMKLKITRMTRKEAAAMGAAGGYQGQIESSYDSLVSLFGEPKHPTTFDDKIQAEWIIKHGDIAAYIYDWKTYKDPKLNTLWNIGGGERSFMLAAAAIYGEKVFKYILEGTYLVDNQ